MHSSCSKLKRGRKALLDQCHVSHGPSPQRQACLLWTPATMGTITEVRAWCCASAMATAVTASVAVGDTRL